jgi:hypothetical protein
MNKILPVALIASVLMVSACTPIKPPVGDAYWQRIEDSSALYLTGPKAQQRLEQNIAGCVREIDELVRLDAIRETTPPDTNSDYRRALDASGDLAFYDTPTRIGDSKVDHSNYHDFESCMRAQGWERSRYVRMEPAMRAETTYKDTKDLRKYGTFGAEAQIRQNQERAERVKDYKELNQ